MKIVYIAHPISGDIEGNLEKIRQIARHINLNYLDIVPFAPYWLDCHALNDNVQEERERGIANDAELIKRGFVDEMWLFGHKISSGMKAEVELAVRMGIKVVPMSPATKAEFSITQ